MPTLAVVHDNIDESSSIGAIASWDVRTALSYGWDVLAVCRDLDPTLAGQVRHVPLYVPPRLHLVQYAAARRSVRAALRGLRPDVLFVHQPQLAGIADLWNVHYLERAAREAGTPPRPGARSLAERVQTAGVVAIEDRYLRRVPAATRVLFCGDGLAGDFARLYGEHSNSLVVPNPATGGFDPLAVPDPERRRVVTGGHDGPVVGFLGGADPRKGADVVRRAVESEPELFLVHAGPSRLDVPGAPARHRDLGMLGDVRDLLDVVDALVVPSRFDPFPLVVPEAAARGVPVIAARPVGSAALIESCGAGMIWDMSAPLSPLVRRAVAERAAFRRGCELLVHRLDADRLAAQRFAEIEAARDRARRS